MASVILVGDHDRLVDHDVIVDYHLRSLLPVMPVVLARVEAVGGSLHRVG